MATYLERSLGLNHLRRLFWAVFPIGVGLALGAPLIARGSVPLWVHSAVVLVMVVTNGDTPSRT